MQQNIIKYYEKITDLALKNLVQEKSFQFKSKLNNKLLSMQSQDHLIEIYKKAGGGVLSDNAKKLIQDYNDSISQMYKIAIKDYNNTLNKLKNITNIDEKQKILNGYANKGIAGFKARNGAVWNIETYSNMLFTHANNEMVRLAILDNLKDNKVRISSGQSTRTCDICKKYEGEILTLDELEIAKEDGLFHPNCIHFIVEVE